MNTALTRDSAIRSADASHISRHGTRAKTSGEACRGSHQASGRPASALHRLVAGFLVLASVMVARLGVPYHRSGVCHAVDDGCRVLDTPLAELLPPIVTTPGCVVRAPGDQGDGVALLEVVHGLPGIVSLPASDLNGRFYGAEDGVGAHLPVDGLYEGAKKV